MVGASPDILSFLAKGSVRLVRATLPIDDNRKLELIAVGPFLV
jgi:hypothetical protein